MKNYEGLVFGPTCDSQLFLAPMLGMKDMKDFLMKFYTRARMYRLRKALHVLHVLHSLSYSTHSGKGDWA